MSPVSDGIPPPRRYRPARRHLALLGLILLVLIVRLIWGWWTDRALKNQLAAIRARGEPVSLDDFALPPIPDAENAWFILCEAADVVQRSGVDSPANSNLDFPNYPPYPREWMELADASEKAHAKAFELARKARQFTGVQIPRLSDRRYGAMYIAAILYDGAIYAHFRSDDDEALERLLDLWHLSRTIRQDEWTLGQLFAFSIDERMCRAALIIGPGLRLDSNSTRQRLRQLIDQLLEEQIAVQSLQRSMRAERLVVGEGQQRAKETWLIRPLAARSQLRMHADFDLIIEATSAATAPEMRAILARSTSGIPMFRPRSVRDESLRYSRWVHDRHVYFGEFLDRHFRIIASRRTTATALACQLYRADHGDWPQRLQQLVPDYLPAVPADPFYADGRALGYTILKGGLPDGGDRPLIHFDGESDPYPAVRSEPQYELTRDSRQYRDLTRFVPPPSAETVDDEPEEPDAPGDQPEPDDQAEEP
jgi:hypothetical protein